MWLKLKKGQKGGKYMWRTLYRKRQHSAHEKAGCTFEKYGFDPGCSVAKAFV